MFKKGFKIGFIIGAILAVSGIGYVYYVSKTSIEKSQKISKVKNFNDINIPIMDLDGKTIDLRNYGDKTILINIWGTWCAPCVKEMPLLQETYNQLKEEYVFVMISDEDPQKIKEFTKKNNYDFEFVQTEKNLKSIIGVFPTTFILDREGNIVYHNVGSFEDYSKTDLLELLTKKRITN